MKENQTKGIIWVLIAAISLSLMSALVKHTSSGASTGVMLFGRFLCSLVWVLILSGIRISKGEKPKFKSNRLGLQFIRAVFSCCALGCVFYSLRFISLVDCTLLTNTYTLFIPIIAFIVLGVKTSKKVWCGIVVGFIGIIIILGVSTLSISFASGVALLSGFLAACSIIIIRRLTRYDHVETTMFYYYLFGSILSLVLALYHFHMPSVHTLYLVLLIGIVGTLYQVAFTHALHCAPARTVTPLMYISVIFSGLLGWLLWRHMPNSDFYIGMALVIGSAIYVIINAKDNAKGQHEINH